MVFHIVNAWGFRTEIPEDASAWTVIRPYWVDREGSLADSDIRRVMESHGFCEDLISRVIAVSNL